MSDALKKLSVCLCFGKRNENIFYYIELKYRCQKGREVKVNFFLPEWVQDVAE